jgi:hypothetical protein
VAHNPVYVMFILLRGTCPLEAERVGGRTRQRQTTIAVLISSKDF